MRLTLDSVSLFAAPVAPATAAIAAIAAVAAIAAILFVLEVILWPTVSRHPNLFNDLLAERRQIPILEAKSTLHFCPNILGRHVV